MKRLFFIIPLLVLSGITACKNKLKTVKVNEVYAIAGIEKTPCFGSCPVYIIVVNSDKTLTLDARDNLNLKGKFQGVLTGELFAQLEVVARKIGYFQMQASYDNPSVTDLPTTKTFMVLDGKRHEVSRRIGHPKELKEFESLFEQMLEKVEWKPFSE